MDIQNFFFKQIPTYQEIHRLQTSGEKSFSNVVKDFYSIRGLAKATMKAYTSTPPTMVVHMPVGAGYCRVNENIGNLGSVEKILRIGWNEPLAIDCSLDFNLSSTIPSPGMKRYISVFARFKRSEENQRVNYLGETIFYDLKESFEILVVSGVEAASDPARVSIEQENCILLFDVLLNEYAASIGISDALDPYHPVDNEIDMTRVEYLSTTQNNNLDLSGGKSVNAGATPLLTETELTNVDVSLVSGKRIRNKNNIPVVTDFGIVYFRSAASETILAESLTASSPDMNSVFKKAELGVIGSVRITFEVKVGA